MQLFYQANVPVNQNLLYKTMDDAKNTVCGELDIYCNEDTGFIYNSAFKSDLLNYTEEYNNNQHHSPYFSAYVDEQIERLIKKYIYHASTLIEVGCGKGYFARKVAKKLPLCKVYGFDTSFVQDSEEELPNLHFFKKYYNDDINLNPDVIICRHVIEHIHNPVDFLSSIRASMPENSLLFLETPDVNWILENNVIYDFFYEHCSYFNIISLDTVLRMSGFEPIETKHTFNGQYMSSVSRAVNSDATNGNKTETQSTLALCRNFTNNRESKMNSVSDTMQVLSEKGKKIFIWGQGQKALHLLIYLINNKNIYPL